MKSEISIVRAKSRLDSDQEEIRIILKVKMGRTITLSVKPEDFSLALTGRSEVPTEVTLRNLEISYV